MTALPAARIKRYYDRFGSLQDRQGFYEDRALDELVAHAAVGDARRLIEFGCGTGRLARRMLDAYPGVHYTGFDVSTTMVGLARARLQPLGSRAEVIQLDPGAVALPRPDASADRILSTYVLDLLPEPAILQFLAEAGRVLQPGGLLCLAGITPGVTALSRVVMATWHAIWRLSPGLVGGCRPLRTRALVEAQGWTIVHARTVVSWGVASEVTVASPPRRGS